MKESEIRQLLADLQIPPSLIGGVDCRENAVTVVLQADSPNAAGALAPLQQQIEQALLKAGAGKVQVVITADKPQPKAPRPVAPGVKAIIAIASGKGGVGKSTVTTNLAAAAQAAGLKVGLLDADIYGPSQPVLMGLPATPPPLDSEKRMIPPMVNGVKVMSIGFMVDPERALVWRGPMVHSAINQMLRDVAWGELDILFVDMPPGTGDAQISLAQNAGLAGAIIVSTPQDLALADARRGIAMFGQVKVPVLGLVENMSVYTCPHCGEASHPFGHGGARDEAAKLGVPFLGALPLDITVRETSDSGSPIVWADPQSAAATAFVVLFEEMRGRMKEALG